MFLQKQLENIITQYRENKLPHAFLLETNDFNKCYFDILKLIKIINCPNEYRDDCDDDCNLCNLIDKGNLPSLEVIYPQGAFIKKNQITEMMQKFSTKPVFSKYNMYILNNAECLNGSSGNTILKFLEEPNENILGFLITNNKENVLATIRSRCQIISCMYDEEEKHIDNEYIEDIKDYLSNIYKNNDDLLYNKQVMSDLYKDRKSWEIFFQTMLYYFKDSLNSENVNKIPVINNISPKNLINMMFLVENMLKYIKSNGNIDLILDKFVIEMRNYYE